MTTPMRQFQFRDREDAGMKLAAALQYLRGTDTVILALPRGGVVVGNEIAQLLELPLGLILVRKIRHPEQLEYAIGAMAEDGELIYDSAATKGIDEAWLRLEAELARELIEMRRNLYYDSAFVPPIVKGKNSIIVDDGMATGLTMKVAVQAIRKEGVTGITVVVPVASIESTELIRPLVNELIVLENPIDFKGAIGAHYERFEQVADEEVRKLLLKDATKAAQGYRDA